MRLCEEIVARAKEGLSKTKRIECDFDRLEYTKSFIETLWEEQKYVANEVIKSLQATADF